jgi:hypothetical protein
LSDLGFGQFDPINQMKTLLVIPFSGFLKIIKKIGFVDV